MRGHTDDMLGATGEQSSPATFPRAGRMRRLVIVADTSLIIEAIRIGFRESGEFRLVASADGRRTSAETVLGAEPDVVLLDDMDRSERAIELTRAIADENEHVAIIVLSVEMEPGWLEQIFEAGATGVISKATHPVALATLVRETLNGRIYHTHKHLRGKRGHVSSCPIDHLPLTTREAEILQLVASGSTNGDVARHLWVTEQTVKFHLRNIYRKLDVANRTQASRFAYANGLVGGHPRRAQR